MNPFRLYAEPSYLAGGHCVIGLGDIDGQDFVSLTNEAFLDVNDCKELIRLLTECVAAMESDTEGKPPVVDVVAAASKTVSQFRQLSKENPEYAPVYEAFACFRVWLEK